MLKSVVIVKYIWYLEKHTLSRNLHVFRPYLYCTVWWASVCVDKPLHNHIWQTSVQLFVYSGCGFVFSFALKEESKFPAHGLCLRWARTCNSIAAIQELLSGSLSIFLLLFSKTSLSWEINTNRMFTSTSNKICDMTMQDLWFSVKLDCTYTFGVAFRIN